MGDRVASARRRDFIGRRREVDRFRALLDGTDGGVVLVHGPGGVGKTTLLAEFGLMARERGRVVVCLDGRDVAPIPAAVLTELARTLPGGGEPMSRLAEIQNLVVLVDTAELLTPLDRWWREELLPELAGGAIAVVAGREAPSLGWRTDPGWRDLLHTMALDNLDDADARALLASRGVSGAQAERALAFTRGHPLALALMVDVAEEGGAEPPPVPQPEVVAALLGTLVASVPSARHRAALEASALVLSVTEPLLTVLIEGPDVREVFEWLRDLSIMQTGPRGLFLHDLARDLLASDLRWRHPERYAALHRAAGEYFRAHFYAVEPALQQQVLVEYVFLHRENPVLGPLVTGSAASGIDLRSLVTTPAGPEDREIATDLVRRHEGVESAAWFGYWWERAPGATVLLRGPDEAVLGLLTTLQLAEIDEPDRAGDPAVALAFQQLEALRPLKPGERASLFRFWLSADGYQDQGPVQLFLTLQFVRFYLTTPNLAVSFVSYADPLLWAPICAYADVHPVRGDGYAVGGHSYGLFFHDWRARPPMEWLALLGERELSQAPLDVGREQAAEETPAVDLTDREFSDAVRAALRAFSRPDGLRGSRLLGAPLVLSRTGPTADPRVRAAALREAIRGAASRMENSPRDRRGFRAVHHTYLQPAATQADAARLLDLPTTTYRRHLAQGIERLTELLRQDDLDAR